MTQSPFDAPATALCAVEGEPVCLLPRCGALADRTVAQFPGYSVDVVGWSLRDLAHDGAHMGPGRDFAPRGVWLLHSSGKGPPQRQAMGRARRPCRRVLRSRRPMFRLLWHNSESRSVARNSVRRRVYSPVVECRYLDDDLAERLSRGDIGAAIECSQRSVSMGGDDRAGRGKHPDDRHPTVRI